MKCEVVVNKYKWSMETFLNRRLKVLWYKRTKRDRENKEGTVIGDVLYVQLQPQGVPNQDPGEKKRKKKIKHRVAN